MFKYIIHVFFTTFTLILFGRILLSWFPKFQSHRIAHFLRFYTDPYLNVFRRIVPPIGGMLDLSPILGFMALRFIESFLMGVL